MTSVGNVIGYCPVLRRIVREQDDLDGLPERSPAMCCDCCSQCELFETMASRVPIEVLADAFRAAGCSVQVLDVGELHEVLEDQVGE